MRKVSIAAMTLAAVGALSLTACSEKTQDNAAETATSAANDVSDAATDAAAAASDAVDKAGAAADQAADKAAVAAGKMGDHMKQGAAEAEATLQDEPVSKAKAD